MNSGSDYQLSVQVAQVFANGQTCSNTSATVRVTCVHVLHVPALAVAVLMRPG